MLVAIELLLTTMTYQKIINDLQKLKNPAQAKNLQRFFKTGKGEYGAGDIFLGISVPEQRKIAKKYYQDATFADIQKLLNSKIHEHRLVALLMLVAKFNSPNCHPHESEDPVLLWDSRFRGNDNKKKEIFKFYFKNIKNINNWDLVDLSAHKIVGSYLLDRDKKILYKLARSKNLWERRVAIISTFEFIRHSQFNDSIKIAKILLKDKQDLIHKAVGWMLREIGKKDLKILEKFLDKYHKKMPRVMLRYDLEKLPENKRKFYLMA